MVFIGKGSARRLGRETAQEDNDMKVTGKKIAEKPAAPTPVEQSQIAGYSTWC